MNNPRRVANMAEEVISSEASTTTAGVVGMVLLCSLLANYLKRFNSNFVPSDSILAIIIGFVASLPFCSYDEFSGSVLDMLRML